MDLILLGIIIIVVSLAGYSIYRSRKNGVKCIGCPHSKVCDQNNMPNHKSQKISIDEIL